MERNHTNLVQLNVYTYTLYILHEIPGGVRQTTKTNCHREKNIDFLGPKYEHKKRIFRT